MMQRLLLVLLFLFPSLLYAQQPVLTITEGGYFLTEVQGGFPVYVQVHQVIDLTGGNTPTPLPPPGPGPTPPVLDVELAKTVNTWAKEVNDTNASQALAIVYATVKVVGPKDPWTPIRLASDKALEIVGSKSDWTPFRAKLSEVITERDQKGTLDAPIILASVQQGLEMSADGSDALPVTQVAQIVAATQEVLSE